MIIDDHQGIRSMIRDLLDDCLTAMQGCRPVVVECDSDEAALQAVTGFVPDVVTLDLRMNGMDGRHCVRRLRLQAPGALIVVVTGLSGESVARHAYLAGANGVVSKDDLTALQGFVRVRLPGMLSP
jgi:DNA-binding NarL/FixJ family response regulator